MTKCVATAVIELAAVAEGAAKLSGAWPLPLALKSQSSGPNLTFRFSCGFPCRLGHASLGNARKNPDQTERHRPSRVEGSCRQPEQPAEACLAGQDRPADSRRARHRRDRAADRKG